MRIKNYESGLIIIGEKLEDLREKKGFSTSKGFAEKYDLPSNQYWKVEKGRVNLTLKSLMRVLEIHHLSLEEFLCEELEKAAA